MTDHKIATGIILKYMKGNNFRGWTSLWDTIYYATEEDMKDESLRSHELCHIEQMERDGKFMFMIKYMWHSLLYGYKDNLYEVEARKNSNEKGNG